MAPSSPYVKSAGDMCKMFGFTEIQALRDFILREDMLKIWKTWDSNEAKKQGRSHKGETVIFLATNALINNEARYLTPETDDLMSAAEHSAIYVVQVVKLLMSSGGLWMEFNGKSHLHIDYEGFAHKVYCLQRFIKYQLTAPTTYLSHEIQKRIGQMNKSQAAQDPSAETEEQENVLDDASNTQNEDISGKQREEFRNESGGEFQADQFQPFTNLEQGSQTSVSDAGSGFQDEYISGEQREELWDESGGEFQADQFHYSLDPEAEEELRIALENEKENGYY